MSIDAPGLVYGMSDEIYHADPIAGGSLSSTFARLLTEHVPAKAIEIRRNRKPTKAMNLGKAAHAHALGAGPELIVWEHDGRTKEGKAERASRAFDIESERAVAVTAAERASRAFDIESERAVAVTAAERAQILDMAEVLQVDLTLRGILDSSQPEVSGFWREGEVWCRARYDLLGDGVAYDYKTTIDATRRGFSKAMGKYGYHQQGDFYTRGLATLGHKAATTPLRFICQESVPPYLVQIHTPDDVALSVAKELNDIALEVYARCQDTGDWPGFPTLEAEPTGLPAWYLFEHETDLEIE